MLLLDVVPWREVQRRNHGQHQHSHGTVHVAEEVEPRREREKQDGDQQANDSMGEESLEKIVQLFLYLNEKAQISVQGPL